MNPRIVVLLCVLFALSCDPGDGVRVDAERRAQRKVKVMSSNQVLHKTLIVGLIRYDAGGRLVEQTQTSGVITRWSADGGLVIRRGDGSEFVLPSDLSALQVAPPGSFREHASGKTIVNPDFICMWQVHDRPGRTTPEWRKGPGINFPPAAAN